MLTRNFDSIMAGYLTVLPSKSLTPKEADWLGGIPGVVKNHYGLMRAITYYQGTGFSIFGHSSSSDNISQVPQDSSVTAMPIMIVGKSNAEETYYDYALDDIAELTTIGTRYVNMTYNQEGCVYNTIKTFVNNSDNDITVNEIGIYQHIEFNHDVLLYRKKLDKSVTLKANGGTATFNLVIDIPYANKP